VLRQAGRMSGMLKIRKTHTTFWW